MACHPYAVISRFSNVCQLCLGISNDSWIFRTVLMFSHICRRSHVCLFCVNDKHANGEKYRHRCGKHENCAKYPRVVCLYAQILHIQLLRGGLQISAEMRHLWVVIYHRVSVICHGLTICHLSVCIFPTVFFYACHLCAVNSRCVHLCHLYL